MKKIISIILTLVMALAMVPMAYAFTDVPEDAEYAEAVNYCVNKELMNGTGDNKFSPGDPVTRAMAVTILYRQQDEPDVPEDSNKFDDITEKYNWCLKSISWAVSEGLVKGYNEKKFGPGEKIKFGEILTILWRFAEKNSEDDEETVKNWAKNQGIFKDNDNWDGEVTRYKLAMLIYTYFEENNSKPSSTGEAVATVTPAPETTNAPEVTATTTPVATGAPVTTENPKSEIGDDNYTTYSDIYIDNNGEVKELRNTLEIERAYSVNKIGDSLLYVDADYELSKMKIDDKTGTKIVGSDEKPLHVTSIKAVGDMIYGIRTDNDGDVVGELFKISVDDNGRITGYEHISDNAYAFKIKGQYCYFVDTANEDSLKYVDLNADDLSENINSTNINKITYYNIIDDTILYYSYTENKLILSKLNNDSKILYDNVSNMNGINIDYIEKIFYAVVGTNDGKYSIISVDQDGNKNNIYESAEKISHLTLIGGKIYARVNNVFQDIKINQ